ncbi:MAG: FliM/FliN family flagellar motor switch protein [Acidimicrobiales bacterium]
MSEGNPFQQARPLTAERAQLFSRSTEAMCEKLQEDLGRWLGETRVQATQVETTMIPALALPDHHLTLIKARYHMSHGLIAVELKLGLTLVSMLCGGIASPVIDIRPLNRLEMGVLELVLAPVLNVAAETFDTGPLEVGAHLSHVTSLPDSKPEPAVSVSLALKVGNVEGRLVLGLTMGQLQVYSEEMDRRIAGRVPARTNTINVRAARAVAPVPVELAVGFDLFRVPAGQLAGLRVGDVVRTCQSVTRPLVGRIGPERLFHVRAAQRGQRLVAEVTGKLDPGKATSQ